MYKNSSPGRTGHPITSSPFVSLRFLDNFAYFPIRRERAVGRFGYEYFEKLSTVAVKGIFVEQISANSPPEEVDLGVITLGVNGVCTEVHT